MAYPTVVTHSKRYPATSVMSDPYSCDNTGTVDIYDGISQLKADQANVGTMLFPAGTYLVDTNLTIPTGMVCELYAGASFSISTGKVLTIASPTGINYKTGRIIYGNGTVSFADGSLIRTSWFGGIVNLLNYLEGSPTINVCFDMDETITNNLEIPDNIRICSPFGITITIADLVTLTISGPVDIGKPLTFVYVGSGNVIYNNTSALTYLYIYPQMWGALGDGTTDDTTAMQSCFDSGYDLNVPIYLPPGTYLCQPLTYGENAVGAESDCAPEIYGAGNASIIKIKAGSTGVFFSATNIKNKILRDFVIDGNDVAGITTVIDTSYYTAASLNNVYRNIRIYNYPGIGWAGDNNDACVWDHVSITDPKDSTNQKAMDLTATALRLSDTTCDGYIAFSGVVLNLDSVSCYGLSLTAYNVSLVGCTIQSNSVTSACISGTIDSLSIAGGTITTVAGRNHIKGTYDLGGVFNGVSFFGASAEDIFEGSVAASSGVAYFYFSACQIWQATLNFPTTILVYHETVPLNTKTVYYYTGTPHTWTVGRATKWVFVQGWSGSGGGGKAASDGVIGGGGGGSGYFEKWITRGNITASGETVTIGAAGTAGTSGAGGNGGTTSFGAHCTATGGGGGGAGTYEGAAGTGGAGGVASGGDLNVNGFVGNFPVAGCGGMPNGGPYGSWGGWGGLTADANGTVGAAGCCIITEFI